MPDLTSVHNFCQGGNKGEERPSFPSPLSSDYKLQAQAGILLAPWPRGVGFSLVPTRSVGTRYGEQKNQIKPAVVQRYWFAPRPQKLRLKHLTWGV